MTVRPGGGERLYRGMLALYPVEFRRRFGDEMVQLCLDRLRDARAGRGWGGTAVVWIRLLVDVVSTAPGEHLRRNRTVAHSAASAPSVTTRALGIAGIGAGLAILAAYVVTLPDAWFFWRLIAFQVGVSAIGIGIHLRQVERAPALSRAVTVAFLAANAGSLAGILMLPPGHLVAFWTSILLWLVSTVFVVASAVIGAVSRIGCVAVAVGSLVAITGIDRLGLVSEANPTVFNTVSQVGIVTMAAGWIVLGLDVAFRHSDRAKII